MPRHSRAAKLLVASSVVLAAVSFPEVASADPSSITDLKARVVDLVFRVVDLDGASTVTTSGGQITISLSSDVLFAFDSAQLTISRIVDVTKVAAELGSISGGTLQVYGYTDSIGTDAVNVPLSQQRAQAVATILQPLLASTGVTFDVKGFGSADPVAPNTLPGGADNPAGRAQNRRVTLHYVPAGSPAASP